MGRWRFWLHSIVRASQYNPVRFVELLMLAIAMTLLGTWHLMPKLPYLPWPFLVLGLGFIVGAAMTMLVREAIAPSSHPQLTFVAAFVLLLTSTLYVFYELSPYMPLVIGH